MSITHTDPLANFRMFEDAFSRLLSEPRTGRPWSPSVDIFETENEVVLKADVPGVELKDIEVRVENQTLTVKGERQFEQEEQRKGYHRIERSYGAFTRTVRLPVAVEGSKVDAKFKNGLLTVTLPKTPGAKGITVPVKAE